MAEYIEREALMKNFCGCDLTKCVKYGNKDADQQHYSYSTMMMYEIADEIIDAPAADVAPVRHGKWENVQETDMYVPEMKFTLTKTAETCSVCKARVGFVGAKQYLFDSICPSCGARMGGEQ